MYWRTNTSANKWRATRTTLFRTIMIIIKAACIILLQTAAGATISKVPFTLDDITGDTFLPDPFVAKWISGSELLFEEDDKLRIADLDRNKLYDAVPNQVFAQYMPIKWDMSHNKKYVLFAYDAEKIFQAGAIARYVAYDIDDNTTTDIGGGERLQAAFWSGYQNQLAYIYGNNIYYLPEPAAQPIQVTTDGVPGVIFNGLYYARSHESVAAEDSLDEYIAAFSLGGTKLGYVQYNVSLLRNASFIRQYGAPGSLKHQYVTPATFRYQKVGTPGSRSRLKVVTLPSENSTSVATQELMAPVDVVGEEFIIDEFHMIDEDIVVATFMNRFQNVTQYMTYFTCNKSEQVTGEKVYGRKQKPAHARCLVNRQLATTAAITLEGGGLNYDSLKGLKLEQKGGWFNRHGPESLSEVGNPSLLTIAWQPQGDVGSFPHVVTVEGNTMKAVTSGQFTVTDLYGEDDNGTVYYQATEEGEPSRRQVYAVEEGGTPRCLSCNLKSPEGNLCLRASASFSHDLSWYTMKCIGPDPPIFTVHSATHNIHLMWEDHSNIELRKELSGKQLPQQLDDWVEVEGGMRAQVRLLLPPDLDPEGAEKRPAIVYVYASPESQEVDDSFDVNLSSYFTTSRRYVVILIDGRGSGCKGDRMLFSIYRRLGTVEVEDQINVTKWLIQKYHFIDQSRVGIWGWSYGGYAAAMALARDEDDVFKCGASVAPVTNWIYGNVDFCEEFMDLPTPEDNEAGYNDSDVTRLAARFANKKFLLVHGTADDHTFYQNSMLLARALEEAGVLFRQQIYPDQHHWLNNRLNHLYHTMDEFFQECFDPSQLLVDILREKLT